MPEPILISAINLRYGHIAEDKYWPKISSQLNSQETAYFKQFKNTAFSKLQFLTGRCLVKKLLLSRFQQNLPQYQLEFGRNFRPQLTYKGLKSSYDIAISHHRNIVIAVLSPVKIGIDVQTCDNDYKKLYIANRYFKKSEQKYLQKEPTIEKKITAFYNLWTLKEAWLKQKGQTVFNLSKVPAISFYKDIMLHFTAINIKFVVDGDIAVMSMYSNTLADCNSFQFIDKKIIIDNYQQACFSTTEN